MKARIENGNIIIYPVLPSDWKNFLNFKEATTLVQQNEGFYDVVTPLYDSDIERLGEIYFDETNKVFTYPVINKTVEEIATEKEQLLETIENNFDVASIKRLLTALTVGILEDANVTQQNLDDLATIYPQYRIGKSYVTDEKFTYEGNLYKVIQVHTSQADWVPSSTPSLYTKYTPPNVVSEWVQPTGSTDAYLMGAKVTHNGHTWESTVNANVWEPGIYGWNQL